MKVLKLVGQAGLWLLLLGIITGASIFAWWRFGDWQARAVQDVEFVHETILRHHPGAVDPENPAFTSLMEDAWNRAMLLAEAARTPADHNAALDAYTDTFQDGHLSIFYAERALTMLRRSGSDNPLSAGTSGIDIEDNTAWITITSFNERRSSITELTQQVEAQANTLRSLDRIIFDLRGNSGGNSNFGRRIATALWSAEVYLDWVPVSAASVDWRASPENARHVHDIARRHADRGRESQAAAWTRTAESIDRAVQAGDDYASRRFAARETTRTVQSPVSAQVVVITDDVCASSCLDFMDMLMALPNVLHLGEETSSDTQYIDVRHVDLPSRTGRMFLPLKVYRGRLRPSGGSYVPAITVDPADLDSSAMRALLSTQDAGD